MNKFLIYFVAAILLTTADASWAQKSKKRDKQPEQPQTEKVVEKTLSNDEKNEFEYTFIEALKQKMVGNQQVALSLFSKCLSINPSSASAMFELAKIYSGNGDMTGSALLLERAIKIDPENKWYKVLLAQILQQGKQYEKAAALYSQLLKSDPENLDYLYMSAALLSSAQKYDQAIEAYNKLEKKVGISDQISVEKQQVYSAGGKKKEAVAELQKLIKSNPKEPRYYGLMADYYLSEKDEVNALKYYNKILEIDPDNGFVLFSLASYFREKGDKQNAWEYLEKGFRNKTVETDTKIQYYVVVATGEDSTFFTKDQIGQLVDILVKTNSDDYRVYTVYAEYLFEKGKLAEAREQLLKVISIEKSNFAVWQRLILLSNDLMDFQAVYRDVNQALELFPEQSILYGLKALACLQLEKYEEVIKTLDEGDAYTLDNKQMKIQFDLYRAEANYKLDRVEEAFKAFDDVLKVDPENWLALNNYAYYLSVRNENLAKAEQMAAKAVRANSNNATYLDTYAWVLFMRKDYNLARFYMETALKNGGDKNGVIVEHYGDILFMLGRQSEALEQWKKAKEVGETSEFLDEKIKQERYLDKK